MKPGCLSRKMPICVLEAKRCMMLAQVNVLVLRFHLWRETKQILRMPCLPPMGVFFLKAPSATSSGSVTKLERIWIRAGEYEFQQTRGTAPWQCTASESHHTPEELHLGAMWGSVMYFITLERTWSASWDVAWMTTRGGISG